MQLQVFTKSFKILPFSKRQNWPKNNKNSASVCLMLITFLQEVTCVISGFKLRGYSQINWVGLCGPLPKTLTLFMTKICNIPYPIYDLTKNSKPYL